jgi:hypothetical protein
MSMKASDERKHSTAPLAGVTRYASAVLGSLALLAISNGAAQVVGGQTGTVPKFPQFYESVVSQPTMLFSPQSRFPTPTQLSCKLAGHLVRRQ